MERDIYVVLNMRRCQFEPQHHRNLANQFCTYSNYRSERLGSWHPIPKRPKRTQGSNSETGQISIAAEAKDNDSEAQQ